MRICEPLIDGLGHACAMRNAVHDRRPSSCCASAASYLSQASCVIVSGFRAALELDTHPLSNLIRPRCAERAKPGRGNPVLIIHIGFFACFHAISRTQSIQQNRHIFHALVALKLLVWLISRPVACSPRIVVDKQTDRYTGPSTVTHAAHARRGLNNYYC